MDCDVSCGGHAAVGQSLEDDGGLQPGEPGAAVVSAGVQRPEAQLRRPLEHVHGEDLVLVPGRHVGPHLVHGKLQRHALHLLLLLRQPGRDVEGGDQGGAVQRGQGGRVSGGRGHGPHLTSRHWALEAAQPGDQVGAGQLPPDDTASSHFFTFRSLCTLYHLCSINVLVWCQSSVSGSEVFCKVSGPQFS